MFFTIFCWCVFLLLIVCLLFSGLLVHGMARLWKTWKYYHSTLRNHSMRSLTRYVMWHMSHGFLYVCISRFPIMYRVLSFVTENQTDNKAAQSRMQIHAMSIRLPEVLPLFPWHFQRTKRRFLRTFLRTLRENGVSRQRKRRMKREIRASIRSRRTRAAGTFI